MKRALHRVSAGRVVFGSRARRRLVRGADITARTVGCTLGPHGRTVLLDRDGLPPIATKDGVTVAREIALEERVAHMGSQVLLAAARRTASRAGDGTTATTLLAGEIARRGHQLVTAGLDPLQIARGIQRTAEAIVEELRARATPVDSSEEVLRVALVAANGDEDVARAVVSAMETVGTLGLISVEQADSVHPVQIHVDSGLWWSRGWVSSSLLRPEEAEAGRVEIAHPLVLLLGDEFGSAPGMASLMEAALRRMRGSPCRGLLVVGEVTGDALATAVANRRAGRIDIAIVRPPAALGEGYASVAEALADFAAATGASVLSHHTGRAPLTAMSDAAVDLALSALGVAEHATVRASRSVLRLASTGLDGRDLIAAREARIAQISAARAQMIAAGMEHSADAWARRLSRLGGGIAVLRIGGTTAAEATARCFLAEDALCAARCAVESGAMYGGGADLLLAAEAVRPRFRDTSDAEHAGGALLVDACACVFIRLRDNAGMPGPADAARLRLTRTPDPALRGLDSCTTLIEVVRNAASAASALLTCEVAVLSADGRE